MDSRLIPDNFGDYVTLRDGTGMPKVLGSGGFGTTICVRRTRRLGREDVTDDFALKLLHMQFQQQKQRDRFIAEIKALRALEHPNVVKYEDCGEKDGLIYLVMQYCRGGDLGSFINKWGAFGERLALQTILQVAEGLQRAHHKKFLHLDLKPSNVLLLEETPANADLDWLTSWVENDRLTFKIADFGLANRLDQEVQASKVGCSPMTCSPEQARNEELGVPSDIYSLGMTLWYLLAGRSPLRRPDGRAMGEWELMRTHTSDEPHDAAFPLQITDECRSVLSRMLKKAPQDRFPSAQALVDAIRRALQATEEQVQKNLTLPLDSEAQLSIVDQPEFGTGETTDYFREFVEFGRRPVGKFYRAVSETTKTITGLTMWESRSAPETEHELAHHLERLKLVTSSIHAPQSLTPIFEVLRTADTWCVAEEWEDGLPLADVLSCRGRSLSVEEIGQLLLPVAEAADFLLKNRIENALLTVSDIRICGTGLNSEDRSALQEPVNRWKEYRVQLSALALSPELAHAGVHAYGEGTIADGQFGEAETNLNIVNAFCRLFYRLAEGSEVAAAADWDENAYTDANRLSAPSNVLLKRAIRGAETVVSVSDLLLKICKLEGVFRIPQPVRSSAFSERSRSRSRMPPVDRTGLPRNIHHPATATRTLPMPPPTTGPSRSRVAPPPPSRTTVVEPAFEEMTIPASHGRSVQPASEVTRDQPTRFTDTVAAVEVAQLAPGAVGVVRSPYGDKREQRVSGPNWRSEARIYCQQTNRLFKLPRILPPMVAMRLEGRFDAVLSPYVEPPQPTRVPAEKWRPEEEITCDHTGLPLVLPPDLPIGEATPDPQRPGVVRSPYGDHKPVTIPPDRWRPGERIAEAGEVFLLPGVLPPLLAVATEIPGCFISPYAPEERFSLPPDECVPGREFDCHITGCRLVTPGTLPAAWRFEGMVRVGEPPETRSPFVVRTEPDHWQPLTAAQWIPGGVVRCDRTQKEFVLPRMLPALPVRPGPVPPSVLSPFGQHEPVPVPPEQWRPGAELTLALPDNRACRVLLPPGDLAPISAIPADAAGEFISPFAPGRRFSLRPWECIPGAPWRCPATQQPLVLPAVFPEQWRWEGQVRQVEFPEVRSPFVESEEHAWQPVAESDWRPNAPIRCRVTGQTFVLPDRLPPLRVKAAPIPPAVLSPFPPQKPIALEPAQWRRSAEVDVLLPTGQPCRVLLPEDILPLGRADLKDLPALPLGTEPQVRARRGAVRSPHGRHPWVEVAARDWLRGQRIVCPSTHLAFWLPAELPPLEAKLGPRPGTIRSPFTERTLEVPPMQWQAGEVLTCPDSGGIYALPGELPLLIGKVDDGRPGFVESPYAPGEPFRVDVSRWQPGSYVICPKTGRRFALPEELPELIVDCEVVLPAMRLVRSPYHQNSFPVRPEDWFAGSIIVCPDVNKRARLPDDLPPLSATALPEKPGFVRSPYLPDAPEQKIARSEWWPGGDVRCAATGRPMRLPDPLPQLPRGQFAMRYLALGAAALVLCAGVAAWWQFSKPEPIVPPPPPLPPSVLVDKAPSPAEWPKRLRFPDGISPSPDQVILLGDKPEPLKTHLEGIALEAELPWQRLASVHTLQVEVRKKRFKPKTIQLERTDSGITGMPPGLVLERELAPIKLANTGERLPFYRSIRFESIEENSIDRLQEFSLDKPILAKTGLYRVSMPGGEEGGVRFAERLVAASFPVEVDVKEPSRAVELRLPAWNVPKVLAGYYRIPLIFKDSKLFRPKEGAYPPGQQQYVEFASWSPVVLCADIGRKGGDFYEEQRVVTSLPPFNAESLLDDTQPGIFNRGAASAAEMLDALVLPPAPTVEGAMQSAAKVQHAASALRELEGKAAAKRTLGFRVQYDFFLALVDVEKTKAWKELLNACLGSGTLTANSLLELSKPVTSEAIAARLAQKEIPPTGLLVKSTAKIIELGSDGAVHFEISRQRIDMSNWFTENKEVWRAVLHPPTDAEASTWRLNGKWQDEACEMVLRGAQ